MYHPRPVCFILTRSFRPDPNGVHAFIVQELQATEDAGQRAWIIGHIPTGSGDFMHDQVELTYLLMFSS